jgi:DNA-binding transcriptional LysR family regulator
MAPIDLNPLRSFIAVYEAGSFSAAARRLGVPRSTVSRAVAALEASMGETLFHRDTRNVATTAEGRQLYDRAAPAFASLELALRDRPSPGDGPSGTLRVTATPDLATMVLGEVVSRFTARYPAADVELHLTYRLVDLVREGFDVGIRVYGRGLRGSSLVARKIGTLALGLYAAPGFLARHGAPRRPEELRDLDWVAFRGVPPLQLSAAGARETVATRARVVCDDMLFAREAIRMGAGVGALPTFVAADDLTSGSLVRVLPSFSVQTASVHFVYPSRRHLPARVTAFRDLLLEVLRQRPLAPSDDG